MQIQQPQNLPIPSHQFSLQDFHQYIQNTCPSLFNKKYFTELSLISDYLFVLCQFSLSSLSQQRAFKFSIAQTEVDEECHTLQIVLNTSNLSKLSWKVLLIQMDKIFKIDIKFFDNFLKKQITLDSFWLNHSLFLNQKISNTYKFVSLKEMDPKSTLKIQLNTLFLARVFQSFSQKAPEIQEKNMKMITNFDQMNFFNPCKIQRLGQKFYEALGTSQNFLKICSFLSIKEIVKLKHICRFIKKYLIYEEKVLFKQLYEYNFGNTGFELNQMNWSKLLDKKRGEKAKSKQGNRLMVNQGIFRTH